MRSPRLYAQTLIIDDESNNKPVSREQESTIASNAKRFLQALKSYPIRAECVSILSVPSIMGGPAGQAITAIFHLVKTQITTLALVCTRGYEVGDPVTLLERVVSSTTWPRLRSIRLVTGEYADMILLTEWLSKCPRLINLEFNWTRENTSMKDFKEVMEKTQIPPLSSLKYLTLTNFGHRTIVPKLITAAPNLVEYTNKGLWGYETRDSKAIIRCLRSSQRLTSLKWLTLEGQWSLTEELKYLDKLECLIEACDAWEGEENELDLDVSMLFSFLPI